MTKDPEFNAHHVSVVPVEETCMPFPQRVLTYEELTGQQRGGQNSDLAEVRCSGSFSRAKDKPSSEARRVALDSMAPGLFNDLQSENNLTQLLAREEIKRLSASDLQTLSQSAQLESKGVAIAARLLKEVDSAAKPRPDQGHDMG